MSVIGRPFRRLGLRSRSGVSAGQGTKFETLDEECSNHAKQTDVGSTIATPMAVLEEAFRAKSLEGRREEVNPRRGDDDANSKELEQLDCKEDTLALREILVGGDEDGAEDAKATGTEHDEYRSNMHFHVVFRLLPRC